MNPRYIVIVPTPITMEDAIGHVMACYDVFPLPRMIEVVVLPLPRDEVYVVDRDDIVEPHDIVEPSPRCSDG